MPKIRPLETTAGPFTEDVADQTVKVYQDAGYKATKKPRAGREGQFMVEIKTED